VGAERPRSGLRSPTRGFEIPASACPELLALRHPVDVLLGEHRTEGLVRLRVKHLPKRGPTFPTRGHESARPRRRRIGAELAKSRCGIRERRRLARIARRVRPPWDGDAPRLGVPAGHRLPRLVRSSSFSTFGIAPMASVLGRAILVA
jgi:hypothetical protein